MKHLFALLLLWLLSQPVLAQTQARPQPQLTTAQLWRALREHPQLDRRRVDLLNELAFDPFRVVVNTVGQVSWPQIDSLTSLSFALAKQLRYPRGTVWAVFLNPRLDSGLQAQKVDKRSYYRRRLRQYIIPQLEQAGDNAVATEALVQLIVSDKSDKSNAQYLRRMLAVATASHSPRAVCHAYREQGYFYRGKGDYYRSLAGFFQQFRTAQQAGLADEVVDALDGQGSLYIDLADYEQAISSYKQAMPYVEQVTPASYQVIIRNSALNGLAYANLRIGNYPRALALLQQAIRLRQSDSTLIIQAEGMIADIYERQRSPNTLSYSREVLKQARYNGGIPNIIDILLPLGRYYLHSGQTDSAIANGQRILKLINATGHREEERINALQLLYQAYALQRNYPQAYAYQSRYLGLRDTLNNEQITRRVTALRFSQNMAQQRARIAQLTQTQAQAEARTRRQRLWLLLALGGLVVVGGGAGLLWRLNRQKQRVNALLAAQKEQLAERAARLGALDEAKNQFFANASHELRTPLTLILGPLDSLLTDATHQLPAAVRAPVALAHRQAQRLQQLVNRILDLTKLQAGRLALHPTPISLGPLLRRVVTQFESLAAQRGIALHGPGPLPEGLRVLLDADKVEEILTNLLINALNHTPAGGAVHVALTLPEAGDQYSVMVRDTGPGIAQAEQARVFERFYQSPQGQAQGGTGLGLALSRELAQLLGGTLTLVSEPGQGAAFTLHFPAPALPAEPAPALGAAPVEELAAPLSPLAQSAPLPAAATAGPRPRVLVVEDQPDLREYLRGLLAPSYEVLLAEDGQAALELLARSAPVDLITTDAMMPRLSGTQLLARLRADPAQHGVPVLMLTARADEAHRLAALTVGVDDYLTKPFATAELLARVRALLARHQVRRQFAGLPPEAEAPQPEPAAFDLAEPLPAGPAAATAALPTRRRAEPAAAELLRHWQAQIAGQLADERFGPAELAELLCLSERTLYRRLGELAGLTPAAWLRELRLHQARHLLETGAFRSVAEVADAAGFASPKYFITLYTERFGRRPADY